MKKNLLISLFVILVIDMNAQIIISNNDTIISIDTDQTYTLSEYHNYFLKGDYINAKLSLCADLPYLISTDLTSNYEKYYFLSGLYARINDIDSASYYLLQALHNDLNFAFFYNPVFKLLIPEINSDSLKKDYLKKLKEKDNIQEPNFEYCAFFDYMMERDQFYRYYAFYYRKNKLSDDAIMVLQDKYDSLNISDINRLIEKYGNPNVANIGKKRLGNFITILMHTETESQLRYYPYIKQLFVQNLIDNERYAYLTDRILVKKGKKQMYGTQLRFDNKQNKYIVFPIKDIKNIDKRRKKMGMEPLNKYIEMINN